MTKAEKLIKLLEKYNRKIAIKGYTPSPFPKQKYEYIIVIPALKEFDNLIALLESLSQTNNKYWAKTLFLFVVNNVKSADEEIIKDNAKAISLLNEAATGKYGVNIAVIDASSGKFAMDDKEGGVGVARKIGMDTALNYFDYNSPSKLIMGCLDADCIVKPNYITAVYEAYNNQNIMAGHVNYYHPMPEDAENKLAIICYEIFLRNYVLGLKIANSPYAIHTIGSTMNCDVEHYIKIGGMNKRKAAEDFYFMEKLAKLTEIVQINSTTIYPSGRGSFRVPFGTGQRVNRYLAKTHDEYQIYSLENFLVLKDWVTLFYNNNVEAGDYYQDKANKISSTLGEFLVQNDFVNQWEKILKNTKSDEQIIKQKYLWFDGFRTLKLVHHLRDNGYPNNDMFPELNKIFAYFNINFEGSNDVIPDINMQEKYLCKIREIT